MPLRLRVNIILISMLAIPLGLIIYKVSFLFAHLCINENLERGDLLLHINELVEILLHGILFFIILFSFIFIKNKIINPCLDIKIAVQALKNGAIDYRMDITNKETYGEVASAFNDMACILEKSHKKLENQKKELSDRNWELQEANTQLEASYGQLQATIEQLNEVEQKYYSLVENIPDIVVVIDKEGIISFTNKSCYNVLGYKRSDIISHNITEILFDEGNRIEITNIYSKFENSSSVILEIPFKKKDGSKIITQAKFTKYFFNGIDMGLQAILRDVTQERKMQEDLKKYFLKTIDALIAAVEAKDKYTEGHSQRVSKYAVSIANKMGLEREHIEEIKIAGILHDIGKIGISDSILLKPGKLTKGEYEEIKKHPAISNKILYPVGFSERILKAIAFHHERYDGKGYPYGLDKSNLSLEAQIIAVADAYDAMTSNRAYRNSLSKEEAIKELECNRGTQFNPEIVDILIGLETVKH